MSQHDYNIANGGGATVRADINNALAAVQSLNSGTTAPTSTVAGMMWYDTSAGVLKMRNATNTAWISAAEVVAQGGQLAGMRNKIINGKMEIAQRGTSFVSPVSGAYNLDRWLHLSSHDGAFTISQVSDTPSDNELQNSLRVSVTTADASIAAGQYSTVRQYVEGFNVRDLIGRTFTLSFRVKSSKTGTHCVAFLNDGGDRSFVAEYTINAANTWETKSITVSGGLITAGTWNWTNGRGLIVSFAMASGSTFNTTANAWQTGNFIATSNQVNCFDTVGNIFAITGVQLEVGAVATPFEHRPYGAELALCQRYYERIDIPIGQPFATLQATSTTVAYGGFTPFKVTKRSGPTVNYVGTMISWNSAGVSAGGSVLPFGLWPAGFNWNVTSASGLVAGNAVQILSSGGTVVIQASAEL
jgi:hypothetical protein